MKSLLMLSLVDLWLRQLLTVVDEPSLQVSVSWLLLHSSRQNPVKINQSFLLETRVVLTTLVSSKKVSCLRQTSNANLYHVTKFPLYLSLTVPYFYS